MGMSCISQIPYPSYATRWVNIRTIFDRAYRYRIRWVSLKAVLDLFGIPFVGRAHNGLDDSANICTILQLLLKCGCNVYQTERILLQTEEQETNEQRILNDKSAGKYDLATVVPVRKECIYVYPSVYGYSLESHTSKSAMTMNAADYSQQSVASISSSSCESIASDCSNKENSIPTMYIPSKVSSESKNRASNGSKDTTITGSCGTPIVGGSSRRYNKKKKNSQLKNAGSASPSSCLKNGSKVGTELEADNSQLQSNKLDSHGSSLSHLQPLMVSELSTSRKV
ncbi:3'-5' exoribonuclease 1 [Orchesella cincta]|uniref:3'-5' exoribonuclease 1 n=1 Tax=Orchesella cincta TaxID=48709 RepID=A0A1D2NFB1_ORCCI|nr:3'-5' exoribonuclease 1 [Orchesella cincta]